MANNGTLSVIFLAGIPLRGYDVPSGKPRTRLRRRLRLILLLLFANVI
jgi:hypothetical protein